MNCKLWNQQLDDFLDDELPQAQRPAFESHARECATCERELQGARRLQAGLAALPLRQLPEEVLQEVLSQRKVVSPGFFRPALAAAAVVAAMIISTANLRQSEVDPELIAAEREVKIALAYFTHVTRQAGDTFVGQVHDVFGDVIGNQVVVPVTDAMLRPTQEES